MVNSIIFLLGLAIGSFINVCIYRLPQNLSIVRPPSFCTSCGMPLKKSDLIPVLSYLLLGCRCRYCGVVISPRYMLVELLTAVLFVWCYQTIGLGPELMKALILTVFLLVISFIDLDHQLILDKVLIWLAGTGILLNVFFQNFSFILAFFNINETFVAGYISWLDMIIGVLLGGGLMLAIAVASRGGMGGGDIKFTAALGIWFGWKYLLLILFVSFVLGGLAGISLLMFKIKGRKDFIPFGPFIASAAYICMLYGIDILRWYVTSFR